MEATFVPLSQGISRKLRAPIDRNVCPCSAGDKFQFRGKEKRKGGRKEGRRASYIFFSVSFVTSGSKLDHAKFLVNVSTTRCGINTCALVSPLLLHSSLSPLSTILRVRTSFSPRPAPLYPHLEPQLLATPLL